MRKLTQLLAMMLLALMMTTTGCVLWEGKDDGRQGHTECGDFGSGFETVYCQPGQYCEDPTFSECAMGCLSNENCAEDQRCVKGDGRDVGNCQNKGKVRPDDVKNGTTPCGEDFDGETMYCQPGQFCENATFSRCELGCLSDANCLGLEVCLRSPGEDIGSCGMPAE